ncbi:unnamed protein product [Mycena citricolor]|uniref:F-box domain-containing protein n=1 Tax=Mycena citricolor TaxID=2018698 RepID=A0AAD2Q3K8_9AGAR|nr:unnamed protein product [Mycena citricolor]
MRLTCKISTLRPSMRDFPPELVEFTLDFLHDDRQSLVRCSEVCRSWVPPSRFHLSSLVFRLLSFCGSSALTNAPNHSDTWLLDLLSSPLCTFAPFAARRICICSVSSAAALQELDRSKLSRCPDSVFAYARALHLKSSLWDADMAAIAAGSKLNPMTCANLTEMTLSCVWFQSVRDFTALLASFPGIRRLRLDRVHWRDVEEGRLVAPSIECMRDLRILHVDYGCSRVVDFLRHLKPGALPHLSAFHLKSADVELDPSLDMTEFSPVFAPALEQVEVGFYVLNPSSLRKYRVNLSCNTSLRSLHLSQIHLQGPGSSITDRDYVDWITAILSSVHSVFIQNIRFGIWMNAAEDLDSLNWTEIGRTLRSAAFGTLQLVQIELFGLWCTDEEKEHTEKRVSEGLGTGMVYNLTFVWH